jgi:hypothetical protein
MQKLLSLILLFIAVNCLNAQHKKGDFFFYWGYNRAAYSASDISFSGPGYDFTLTAVSATDRPTDFDMETYFGATKIWIPQYVYRLGYFVNDHWSISIGLDHMKYIVTQGQSAGINGKIKIPDNPFYGEYRGEQILIDSAFLSFEHTDGLNYLNARAERHWLLLHTSNDLLNLYLLAGGGLGAAIPKSNVQLFEQERSDCFHLAGFGLSATLGLEINFLKFVFIRSTFTGGYINMPSILTVAGSSSDRAKQDFWYEMWDFAIGAKWHF